MDIKLEPGEYIIAVSGGVDSMVLLDLVAGRADTKAIVAHFDHGIHEKSAGYSSFVRQKAKDMGLEFVAAKGNLGPKTSEATAREARYNFLYKIKDKYDASAILTAHHRDDLLETVIINLLRGSGRKGLSSLKSTSDIKRPLLPYTKEQIISYAKKQGIKWREDPTNLDVAYLRNYVRHNIVPKLNKEQKNQFFELIDSQSETNRTVEKLIAEILQQTVKNNDKNGAGVEELQLDRKVFIRLSHNLAKEVLAEFLRVQKISFDAKLLEKLVTFAKTAKTGKKFIISNDYSFEIQGAKVKLNLL